MVGNAKDIYAVDALVTAVERAKDCTKPVSFEVIIETAAGLAHVEEIAAASPRMQGMSLGYADFAASMGMATTGIGGTQENYYMIHEGQTDYPDPWHYAVSAIVAACRTHGIVLTARAEQHLYGSTDLDDTITRLIAYRDAGAEVLYAPGLTETTEWSLNRPGIRGTLSGSCACISLPIRCWSRWWRNSGSGNTWWNPA